MCTILCDAAPAAAQPAEGGFLGGGMGSLLMIVAIFVVFYFFMIRPQQKRQKEVQKMRDALGKGDKIVTAGGIHGIIRDVKPTYFVVEVSNGVSLRIDKTSVYVSSEDAAAAAEQNQNNQGK